MTKDTSIFLPSFKPNLPVCCHIGRNPFIITFQLLVIHMLFFRALSATSSNFSNPLITEPNDRKDDCTTQIGECPNVCICYRKKSFVEGISMFQNLKAVESSIEDGWTVSCTSVGLRNLPENLPNTTRDYLLDSNSINTSANLASVFNGICSNMLNTIRTLSLRRNNLKKINRTLFQNFRALNTLILSHNLIRECTWLGRLTNTRLTYLDLSYNMITTLSLNDFGKTVSLERLDLSHNAIETIEESVLNHLPHLQYLDVSSNNLEQCDLKGVFAFLPNLHYLSLAKNGQLTSLPNSEDMWLSKLETLQILDLHGLRYVKTIQRKAFSGLRNLKSLNLSRCSIKTLEYGWLDGGPDETLRTLDLSQNRLERIESYSFVSSKFHTLANAAYEEVDWDYSSLSYIVSPSVHVRTSSLSPVGNEDDLVPSLNPAHYAPLKNLSWLSLSHNYNLEYLAENAFNYIPNLQYLFLQNCNISTIKIASASVQYSDDAISKTLPHLRGVWVFGNPLFCDCYVRALINAETYSSFPESSVSLCSDVSNSSAKSCRQCNGTFTIDASQYFYEGRCRVVDPAGNATCYPGYSAQSRPITEVPHSQLFCPQEPIALFVAIIIGPLTFAFSILLVLFCGFCTVFFQRFKRYKSGVYYLLSQEYELREKDVPAPSTPQHTQRKRHSRYTPAKSPSSPSPRYHHGTNMVLGNFGSTHSGVAASLPFFDSLLTVNRSPAPSPTPVRKRNKESKSARKHRFNEIQLQDLKKQNIALTKSCPNMSEEKANDEHGKLIHADTQKEVLTSDFSPVIVTNQPISSDIDSDKNSTGAPSNKFLTVPKDQRSGRISALSLPPGAGLADSIPPNSNQQVFSSGEDQSGTKYNVSNNPLFSVVSPHLDQIEHHSS